MPVNILDDLFKELDQVEAHLISSGKTDGISVLNQIRKDFLGIVTDDGDPIRPIIFGIEPLVRGLRAKMAEENDGSNEGGDVSALLTALAVRTGDAATWSEDWSKESIDYLKDAGGMAMHASFMAKDGVTSHGDFTVTMDNASPPPSGGTTASLGVPGSRGANYPLSDPVVPPSTIPLVDDVQMADGTSNLTQAEQELLRAKAQDRAALYGISVRPDGHLTKPRGQEHLTDAQWADPVNRMYALDDDSDIDEAMKAFSADVVGRKYSDGWGTILQRIKQARRRANPPNPMTAPPPMPIEDFVDGKILDQVEAEKHGLTMFECKQEVKLEILEQAGSPNLPKGAMARVRCPLTFADIINSEKQVYTERLWRKQMPRLRSLGQSKRLLGALDHPSDGKTRLASTAIEWLPDTLQMQGNELLAEGFILETTGGKDLSVLIDRGISVEISSRGFGTAFPGKFKGQDVSFIDADKFVCNGFDVVFCGASADGERRTTVERLAQGAAPDAINTEEGLSMDRVKAVEARLMALQESGLLVDKYLKQIGNLPEDAEAAASELDAIEQAAAVLEGAVVEVPAGEKRKEQAYVDDSLTVEMAVGPEGRLQLKIPASVIEDGLGKNPYGGSTANDGIVEDPQDYPKGIQKFGATHPVDTSEATATGRMLKYKQDATEVPAVPSALEQEIVLQKVSRILSQEKDDRKRGFLEQKLQNATSLNDVNSVVTTVNQDYEVYFGGEAAATSSVPRTDMANFATPFFQAGAPDPDKLPPKNVNEAIEKLVQDVDGDFMSLEPINPQAHAHGGYTHVPENIPEGAGFPLGQKSPQGMLRGYLQEFSKTGPGRRLFGQHIALEHAIFNQNKSEWNDVLSNPTFALMQALDTGGTGVGQVAAGQAHLLKVIAAVFPRLIIPYVGAIQPTSKPSATVYFERYKGTTKTGSLTGAGESGTTPLRRFDKIEYTKWDNEVYTKDNGEATDASMVQYSLDSDSVTINAKKLRAQWSFEMEQDLLSYHALDAAAQHLSFMADQIAREINDEILDAMLASVENNVNYPTTPLSGVDAKDWDGEIYTALRKADSSIFRRRGGMANILICAPNIAMRLEKLARTGTPTKGFMQPLVEGLQPMERMWDRYMVFEYSRWGEITANKNKCLLVHRGPRWSSVGVVWVPYTFEVTPLDTTASNFTREIGAMDRSGYSIVNSDCFNSLTATATTATAWDQFIGT